MNELTGNQIIDLPNDISSLFRMFPYIKSVIGLDGDVTLRTNGASYKIDSAGIDESTTYFIELEDGQMFRAVENVITRKRSFKEFRIAKSEFVKYMDIASFNDCFYDRMTYPMMKYLRGHLRTKCLIAEQFSEYPIRDV